MENLTNQAVHELVEDRKKKPLEIEETNEQAAAQEQPKEEPKDATASFTYGTNSDTNRLLFNGSYHTFTTNSSNQLQCTCCPEPILMKATDIKEDFSIGKKDSGYLSTSTSASSKSDYSFTKSKKSSYTF